MDPKQPPGIRFAQIFLNEAHFSHREDSLALPPNTPVQPQEIGISFRVFGREEESIAAMAVKVESKPDPEALYHFSLEMIAIVNRVSGEENLAPREYATRMGVAAVFPFMREALANLTMRGRFGPIWLKPFNVAAAEFDQGAPPPGKTRKRRKEESSRRKSESVRVRRRK